MTDVEKAIVEIKERLAAFAPNHEGLRDFASLNINADTQLEVQALLTIYDRRKNLLDEALKACNDLMADGHPDIQARTISAAAFDDLKANTTSIEAAMGQFVTGVAVKLELIAGTPQPKK